MRTLAALLLTALLLAGCTDTTSTSDGTSSTSSAPAAMLLASPAFANGGTIPVKHTCDGAQTSPPLNVTGLPAGTMSVALTMKDPDVPTPLAPVRTLNHWVVWNATPMDGKVTFPDGGLPAGAQAGGNDFGRGYLGPCPPPGSPAHHYNLTAWALDVRPNVPANATMAQLESAMQGHVKGKATLIGLYTRKVA